MVAFVRLTDSVVMESGLEIPVPVRFVLVLVGPVQSDMDYGESGRAMGALMADWVREKVQKGQIPPDHVDGCLNASCVGALTGLLSGGLSGPDRKRRDQRHRRLHGLQHRDPPH